MGSKDRIKATLLKVGKWARQLRAGTMTSFADVAEAEGISVARVSQLMVLSRLAPDRIHDFLNRSPRPSLRALIAVARSNAVLQPTAREMDE